MGEPGIGLTVLTGTGGDAGNERIDPPQPITPAQTHRDAVAMMASDTPMHSRLPSIARSHFAVLDRLFAIPRSPA